MTAAHQVCSWSLPLSLSFFFGGGVLLYHKSELSDNFKWTLKAHLCLKILESNCKKKMSNRRYRSVSLYKFLFMLLADNGLSLMSIAMIGVLGLLIVVVTALAIMVVKLRSVYSSYAQRLIFNYHKWKQINLQKNNKNNKLT